MRKQQYIPYFFDYKYERRTYKYIGKDYGNRITANKSWIRNITRLYRMRLYNKNETKYKFCNTYEEWENYVKSKLPMRIDCKNYLHWLIEKKRIAESELEVVKAILIPIYIALLSIKEVFFLNKTSDLGSILIIIMVILTVSAYVLWKKKGNLDFWNDLVEIINSAM